VTACSFHTAVPEPASRKTDFLDGVNADTLILQEVDLNARRTHRLNIAETIARKLEMNYVFGSLFRSRA
jgi:endonuclease/exonuclease/phosphatase family metal-dependent hydrolase